VLKAADRDGWTAAKHVWAGELELDSRAVVIGSAVALYVESKAAFATTFSEAPADYKTATSAKFANYAVDQGISLDRLLTETEYHTVCRIGTAVREALAMYRPKDKLTSEASFFWKERGILCKCRPDVFIEGSDIPADYVEIKTAAAVSPHAVRSAFYRYGYHIQQAWYERGIMSVTGALPKVTFLFVATKPPHDIRFYKLADMDAIVTGMRVGELVDEFAKRLDSGDWSDDSITAPTEIKMGLFSDLDIEGATDAVTDL
jgi:hypothetical protein